jgi:hypothetical protein
VDLGEPLVLVVSLGIFLLVVFLDAYAFKISLEHVAVLEVVVRGPFMVAIRTRGRTRKRILFLVLPLVLIATKDGTNYLLVGGVVGDNIH